MTPTGLNEEERQADHKTWTQIILKFGTKLLGLSH
jgi:hypothetical protein